MIEPVRALTFEDHRRELEGLRYVYPVLSRRARGISLGVNLNPDKACNFDCVYCQVDRTVEVPRGIDLDAISAELSMLFARVADGSLFQYPPFDTVTGPMRRVNDVCFAGDGEPTTPPEFPEAVKLAIELKHRFRIDDLKIVLITNATMLHRPRVEQALQLMDQANGEIWAKLDAGTEAYYHQICVTNVPFSRILANLEQAARTRPLVIQSLFLELNGVGPTEEELEAYIGRLRHILDQGGKLKLIQIYSVARKPPQAGIYSLSNEMVDQIVSRVQSALPVPVEGYYGSAQFMRPA